eukprot:gene9237-1521_t
MAATQTATDIGSALYTVLREANAPEKHTEEAYNNMLQYAFTNIHLLRNMSEKQRIAAVWHLVELGGLPLLVNTLQPKHSAMSMGMTLMGMLFKDENLLSHKLGRLILSNKKFLPSIEAGMQLGDDELLPLLVCQVLHNVMRTSSSQHLKEIAAHGTIARQLLFLITYSCEKLQDWRLTFVTVDMILLLEVANAHDVLDDLKHYKILMELLQEKHRSALTEHEPLLNRCLATLFLWAMRTRHTRNEVLQTQRYQLFDQMKSLKKDYPDLFTQPSEVDGKPPPSFHQAATTINLCIALGISSAENVKFSFELSQCLIVHVTCLFSRITQRMFLVPCVQNCAYDSSDELASGVEDHALPLHLTVKSKVRNWDAIEKEAEQNVRSSNFAKVHVSQQGAKEKADPAPVVEVSSSSEDTDEEEEEEDEEKDKRKDNNDTVTTEGLKNASKLDSTMLQVDPTTINSKVDSSVLLQEAICKKTQATTYFRGEMYEDAFEIYKEALHILECAPEGDENIQIERCKLYSNCAECQLRRENYDEVIDLCNLALQCDPKFAKAHYRKAKALQQLGQIEEAKSSLKELLHHDPSHKLANQLLHDLT